MRSGGTHLGRGCGLCTVLCWQHLPPKAGLSVWGGGTREGLRMSEGSVPAGADTWAGQTGREGRGGQRRRSGTGCLGPALGQGGHGQQGDEVSLPLVLSQQLHHSEKKTRAISHPDPGRCGQAGLGSSLGSASWVLVQTHDIQGCR